MTATSRRHRLHNRQRKKQGSRRQKHGQGGILFILIGSITLGVSFNIFYNTKLSDGLSDFTQLYATFPAEAKTWINNLIDGIPSFSTKQRHSYCYEDEKNTTHTPRQRCCAPWDINMDVWWTNRPDWDVALQNATHQCFDPMPENHTMLPFIQNLHAIQWNTSFNCSEVHYRTLLNSGFANNLQDLMKGFMSAYLQRKPFQITKHWSGARWNFAVFQNVSICPDESEKCYFLPITHCKAPYGHGNKDQINKPLLLKEYQPLHPYMKRYMFREQQWVRKAIYEYVQTKLIDGTGNHITSLQEPCKVFHVRRTDVVIEPHASYRRKYFPLGDYINASKAKPGDTLLLLTDDVSAIEEVPLYPQYNWRYVNKTRFRGSE